MPIRGYSVASPTRTLQIVGGLAQRGSSFFCTERRLLWLARPDREDQAETKPQDLSSSGVPTSGRSGRGHEEVVG